MRHERERRRTQWARRIENVRAPYKQLQSQEARTHTQNLDFSCVHSLAHLPVAHDHEMCWWTHSSKCECVWQPKINRRPKRVIHERSQLLHTHTQFSTWESARGEWARARADTSHSQRRGANFFSFSSFKFNFYFVNLNLHTLKNLLS